MKIDEFQRRISLQGADLSRWPVEEVKPALALLRESPEAAKIFTEAERLDQVLRQYRPENTASPALAEQIIKQALRQTPRQQRLSLRSFSRNLYVPGGGLLIAAVVGFMIGFWDAGTGSFSPEQGFLADTQQQIIHDENDDIL